MKYLLRYLDWWANVLLPDKPDEHSIQRAYTILLITQILALTVILGAVMVILASCAQPHRFDPLRQQQLQQQQEDCLRKGGSPQQCRP